MPGTSVVTTVARGVYQTTFSWIGERGRAELQTGLLRRLHELPIAFFDREKSGRIQSLLSEDAANAARLGSQLLSEAVVGTLQLAFVLSALATRYGRSVFAALLLIPVYALFPLFFSHRVRHAAREALAATAEVNTVLHESIVSVREVRVFGRELWSIERLSRRLAGEVSRQLRLIILRSAFGLSYILYFLVAAAVYWWGGLALFAGRLTVGELVAIVVLLGYLETPVGRLTSLGAEYQRVKAAVDRIAHLGGAGGGPQQSGAEELAPGGHRVCFEGVEFRYGDGHAPALRDISFAVEPGELVAIVGPSGAGKSTLVGLLARLYEPQKGRILIDGKDIRAYSVASLRRGIGFVLQETMLFAGTVQENIRFGNLDASDEEVEESARLANADEFIAGLRDGYNSEAGERGVQLSGGQRQRIGIARVLLRQPGALVLDEATSALDTEAERLVREALERLMEDRTTFVISHRPSAFVNADRILVLEAGEIVASGRHEELLATCALYRGLVGRPACVTRDDKPQAVRMVR
jgi:subfamily B ATP-binding cassette protein MsbA